MFKKRRLISGIRLNGFPCVGIGTGIEQGIKPLPQWHHNFSVCLESEVSILAELHIVAGLAIDQLRERESVVTSRNQALTGRKSALLILVSKPFAFHYLCLPFGPVVQRIVCRFPEPKIQVRFLSGLPPQQARHRIRPAGSKRKCMASRPCIFFLYVSWGFVKTCTQKIGQHNRV